MSAPHTHGGTDAPECTTCSTSPHFAPEKQTPSRWSHQYRLKVLDPGGWRADGSSFVTPITEADFLERVLKSTTLLDPGCEL